MAYIYVISATNGFTKIGYAALPFERFSTLQNGSPLILTLAYLCKCPTAREIESIAQEQIADRHSHREWFKISADAAIKTVRETMRQAGYSLVCGLNRNEPLGAKAIIKPGLNEVAVRQLISIA